MEFVQLENKDKEDIIFDVFDLNSLQRDIFQELKNNQLTVQDLADEVDRNRSTVQRSLQKMLDKDLIMREGKTDKTVYYVYTTIPMKDLENVAQEFIDTWYEEVSKQLS